MREWLVIESSGKNAVFASDEARRKGYIPRDVAENLLGRDLGGTAWFTRDGIRGEAMTDREFAYVVIGLTVAYFGRWMLGA